MPSFFPTSRVRVPAAALAVASLTLGLACGSDAVSGGGADAGAPGDAARDEGGTRATAACAVQGGVCLARGETAPPDRAPSARPLCDGEQVCWVLLEADAGGGVVCRTDAECNDDPAASALAGTCVEGTCFCRAGAHVQPSGKCGAASPPPDCRAAGGTCRQEPAACGEGELPGTLEASTSCGDFVAAVCCHPAAACRAGSDFVCCGARAEPYEPTCVNGFRTCEPGAPTPVRRGGTCRGA